MHHCIIALKERPSELRRTKRYKGSWSIAVEMASGTADGSDGQTCPWPLHQRKKEGVKSGVWLCYRWR